MHFLLAQRAAKPTGIDREGFRLQPWTRRGGLVFGRRTMSASADGEALASGQDVLLERAAEYLCDAGVPDDGGSAVR